MQTRRRKRRLEPVIEENNYSSFAHNDSNDVLDSEEGVDHLPPPQRKMGRCEGDIRKEGPVRNTNSWETLLGSWIERSRDKNVNVEDLTKEMKNSLQSSVSDISGELIPTVLHLLRELYQLITSESPGSECQDIVDGIVFCLKACPISEESKAIRHAKRSVHQLKSEISKMGINLDVECLDKSTILQVKGSLCSQNNLLRNLISLGDEYIKAAERTEEKHVQRVQLEAASRQYEVMDAEINFPECVEGLRKIVGRRIEELQSDLCQHAQNVLTSNITSTFSFFSKAVGVIMKSLKLCMLSKELVQLDCDRYKDSIQCLSLLDDAVLDLHQDQSSATPRDEISNLRAMLRSVRRWMSVQDLLKQFAPLVENESTTDITDSVAKLRRCGFETEGEIQYTGLSCLQTAGLYVSQYLRTRADDVMEEYARNRRKEAERYRLYGTKNVVSESEPVKGLKEVCSLLQECVYVCRPVVARLSQRKHLHVLANEVEYILPDSVQFRKSLCLEDESDKLSVLSQITSRYCDKVSDAVDRLAAQLTRIIPSSANESQSGSEDKLKEKNERCDLYMAATNPENSCQIDSLHEKFSDVIKGFGEIDMPHSQFSSMLRSALEEWERALCCLRRKFVNASN